MFIKLEFKNETLKAYQLLNDVWLPKSVLDGRGLEHPYYHIQDWWLTIQVENIMMDETELKTIRKKYSKKDKETSTMVLKAFQLMVITMRDLPTDILEKYNKYWRELSSNVGCYTLDYEPRMYGDECFDGDPYLYGQS